MVSVHIFKVIDMKHNLMIFVNHYFCKLFFKVNFELKKKILISFSFQS